jgi:hypothetical protein
MISIETVTEFFGWCTVLNLILFTASSLLLMVSKDLVSGFHGKLFGISQQEVKLTYFQFMGNYKIAIIVLNLIPYIALKIM